MLDDRELDDSLLGDCELDTHCSAAHCSTTTSSTTASSSSLLNDPLLNDPLLNDSLLNDSLLDDSLVSEGGRTRRRFIGPAEVSDKFRYEWRGLGPVFLDRVAYHILEEHTARRDGPSPLPCAVRCVPILNHGAYALEYRVDLNKIRQVVGIAGHHEMPEVRQLRIRDVALALSSIV